MEDSDMPEEGVVDGIRVGMGEGCEVRTGLVLEAPEPTWASEGKKFGGVAADASSKTFLLDQSVDEEVEASCTASAIGGRPWLSTDAFLESVTSLETPPPSGAP